MNKKIRSDGIDHFYDEILATVTYSEKMNEIFCQKGTGMTLITETIIKSFYFSYEIFSWWDELLQTRRRRKKVLPGFTWSNYFIFYFSPSRA